MKVFSPLLKGDTTTSGSFNVPNHPGTGSIPNPLTGSLFHDDTDGVLKIYTGTQWQVVGEQAVLPPSIEVEYLLVAGGGGAGGGTSGGGGAGGLLSSSLASVESGSVFTVTIGAGGINSTVDGGNGGNGGDSTISGVTISTITAVGGGAGAHGGLTFDGGSGGGGGYTTTVGGSGTTGQGNDGGRGQAPPYYTCGGGGGASQDGGDASNNVGGTGGNGLQVSLTGTPTYYAGGGAGGNGTGTVSGGLGGGGDSVDEQNGQAGEVNTGGGGAGPGTNSVLDGGLGGSGVAIFAYDSGSINAAGGIVGDAGNGRKYHKFNSSGTFKVGNTSDFSAISTDLVLEIDAMNISSYTGTGTIVTDLKGNYNHSLVNISNHELKDGAYAWNCSSNGVIVASTGWSIPSSYTMEAWGWILSDANVETWRTLFRPTPEDHPLLIENNTDTMGYYDSSASTFRSYGVTASSQGIVNSWAHYTLVGTGGSQLMYINGTYIATLGYNSAGQTSDAIGSTNGGSQAFGWISQVRYYNKALSAAEVSQNYNATKTNFI